jgi:TP901 family phage tail tape measure protein
LSGWPTSKRPLVSTMSELRNVIFRLKSEVAGDEDTRQLAASIQQTDAEYKKAQRTVDEFGKKLTVVGRVSRETQEAQKQGAVAARTLNETIRSGAQGLVQTSQEYRKIGLQAAAASTSQREAAAATGAAADQTQRLKQEASGAATAFQRLVAAGRATPLGPTTPLRPVVPGTPLIRPGTGPGVSFRPLVGSASEIKDLGEAAEKAGKKTKDLSDAVGDVGNKAGRSTPLVGSLAKQFLAFFGIDALVRSLFATISTGVRELFAFESALANLSAITGATGEDLAFLEQVARDVGRTSTKSATDALNAFTAIGSARPDLLKNKEALAAVTREAVALSEAAKIDLALAGQAVAGSLNQFGLGAGDASRVINVLAAGSKEGAANIADLSESINKTGTVLAANNITYEQSVGLLETLAEKELKGAVAGTQLRNVVLRLVQAGKGFVDGQFNINAALEEQRAEFEAIKDPVARAEAEVKRFGLESVTAGKILLDNIGTFKKYTDAVTGTAVAYEQQATNNSTLEASFTRLGNNIKDLFLGLRSSTGTLSAAVSFLSNNLRTIVKVVGGLIGVFVAYKAVVSAVSLIKRAYAASVELAAAAKVRLSGATAAATTRMAAFNAVVRSNPIGLLLGLLGAAAVAFGIFGDKAEEASEAQEEFNKRLKEAARLRSELRDTERQVGAIDTLSDEQLAALEQRVNQQIEEANRLAVEVVAAEKEASAQIEAERKKRNERILELERERASNADAARSFDIALEREYLASTSKERLDAELITQKGITAAELNENVARLQAFKASIEERRKLLAQLKRDSVGDGPLSGSIKALQEEQKRLSELLTEKTVIGSKRFFEVARQYNEVAKKLKEARELIEPEEVFPPGSLNALNAELAKLRKELANLPEDAEGFIALRDAALEAERKVKQLQDVISPKDEDETKKRLDRLKSEESTALAIAELDKKAAVARAEQAGATAEQIAAIERDAAAERLRIQLDFELERLAIIQASGKATEEEIQDIQDRIKLLRLELNIPASVAKPKGVKELVEEVTEASEQIARAGAQAWSAWSNAQQASLDQQLRLQEQRVSEALQLAEKGNSAILKEEKRRLAELTEARKRAASQAAAIAQVEAVAASTVAIARAASDGGILAPITIASTLISLAAGFAQARSLSTSSVPTGGFRKGGAADWSMLGGYTGTGHPDDPSLHLGPKPYTYHRQEYIMPHEVVRVGENRKWMERIHRGRVDIGRLLSQRQTTIVPVARDGTDRIVKAIEGIPQTYVRMDEQGITMLVRGKLSRADQINARK